MSSNHCRRVRQPNSKKSPETLLDQLKAAGVGKTAASDPTESDKQKLLAYLQASHGTGFGGSQEDHHGEEVHQRDQAGRCHRQGPHHPGGSAQKRTFIQRDEGAEASAPSPPGAAAVEESAVSREDQELVPPPKKPAARLS